MVPELYNVPWGDTRRWLLTASAVMVMVGCGQSTGPSAPLNATKAPTTKPLSAADLNRTWRWSAVVDTPDVRRIESETWHIYARWSTLSGFYERTVTFLSTDGIPFACNQSLQYQQRTRYRFEGSYNTRVLALREVEYQAHDSPCTSPYRPLLSYRGTVPDNALVLRWDSGEQILTPAPTASRPASPAPDELPNPARAQIAGTWHWQSRTAMPHTGEVRIEIEDWTLSEDDTGSIQGSVTRDVTVFDDEGKVFPCSGDNTYFHYNDRYTIRGRRTGAQLTLTEVDVEAQPHPCLNYQERHHDMAVGTVVGDYLVLTWRGQRRQVLHRP